MSGKGNFIPRLMHFWRRNLAARAGSRIGVGVSAGIDSAVLATVLQQLRKDFGVRRLVLLHLDHGIRPAAERARDMAVLRRLARRIRTPLVVRRARVCAGAAGLEAAAREARHRFYASAARAHRLDSIALGHHLDDRIETFFLSLFRGSGSRGLSSLRAGERINGLTLIRPLLPFTRDEIRAFGDARRVEFHEDSTNADRRFLRNRVRLDLIPLLRGWHPGFSRAMSATIDALESEDAVLSELSEEIFRRSLRATKRKSSLNLDPGALRGRPRAVLIRVLQLADRTCGGSGLLGGHENLCALADAIHRRVRFELSLPAAGRIRVSEDRVSLSRRPRLRRAGRLT